MSATIIDLTTRLAKRPQSNVVALHPTVRIEQVAERIARHRAAMNKLLQEHNLGWQHDCPHIGETGMVPHGERCIWCDATDPTTPDDAA